MTKVRSFCEQGNMLPIILASCLVLFAVVGLVIDQGVAYAVKARQENTLQVVRDACMDSSFALTAKHVQNPGVLTAQRIVETARNEGFNGKITVWFYEEDPHLLAKSERLWIVGVQLEEAVPAMFLQSFALDDIEVASTRVITARPYASEQVWRPDELICGKYEAGINEGPESLIFTAIHARGFFPYEILEALQAAQSE